KIGLDPPQVRRKLQPPRTSIEPGSYAQHGLDAFPRDGLNNQVIQEASANANSETNQLPAGDAVQNRIAARPGKSLGRRIAHQSVGARRFYGAAGGHHEGGVADMLDLVRAVGGHDSLWEIGQVPRGLYRRL